jgi:hypothetical protein
VQNEQKLDMGGVRKDGKTKKDALVFKNRSVLPLIISTYCFARNFAAKLRAKQFQQPHPRLKITPHLNFPKDRPSEKALKLSEGPTFGETQPYPNQKAIA